MTRWQTVQLIMGLLGLALLCLLNVDIPVAILAPTLPLWIVVIGQTITQFGEAWIWLAGSAISWIYFRRLAMRTPFICRRVRAMKAAAASAFLFWAVAASGIAADILKVTVGRPRPRLLRDNGDFTGLIPLSFDAKHWSFPSGHVTTIFAVACALAFFYPRWRGLFFAAALLVAASRLVVGAHYPSDIAGGALIGTLVTYELRRWWEAKYRLPFNRLKR